jgi:hypothetical protein
MSNKTPKIVFAPGCFDTFEGTQDELDEMIAEITRMAESGELLENSHPVCFDDLDDDDADAIAQVMSSQPRSIQ